MNKIIFIKFPAYMLSESEDETLKLNPEADLPNGGYGSDVINVRCDLCDLGHYWPCAGVTIIKTYSGTFKCTLPIEAFEKLVEAATEKYNGDGLVIRPLASDYEKRVGEPQPDTVRGIDLNCPDCNGRVVCDNGKNTCTICGRILA